MKRIQKIVLLLICPFIAGCYGRTADSPEPSSSSVVESAPMQFWQKTEDRVVIVFGFGYTDSPFYENTLSALDLNFGLDSEGGLILPLAFPGDFNYEGAAGRISSLPDIISGKNVKALITVGAPESTHRALAIIQDRSVNNDSFSFPVFSLFPQDDVLGIEAGSHAVLNFARFGSSYGMGEEAGLQHMDVIPSILVSLVKQARDLPLEASSAQLQIFFKTALGSSWNVDVNIDPETSLRSRNHFLISLIDAEQEDEPVVSGLTLIHGE